MANSNRALVATVIAEICSRFEVARLIEREKIPRHDIRAQKLRCDAVMQYFANAQAIKDECARTGSSVKQMFGCGERHLQKIRQLFRKWDEYVRARWAYDGDEFGLKLAFRLVDIPDGSTISNKRPSGAHDDGDATDEPDHGTPDWLFDLINSLLHFTADACATPENTKVKQRFFTVEQNGLLQSWLDDRVWCNPPFGDIEPWLRKIVESGAELVMALLPARLTAKWWREYVVKHATLVIIPPGRLTFGNYTNVARDDIVLVLFARNASWALDALASHLAETVDVGYDGANRVGPLQMVTLCSEAREIVAPNDGGQTQYWTIPAPVHELLRSEYQPDPFDPFPCPPIEGFDALAMEEWPGRTICANLLFPRRDELHGRGITTVLRKVIEQHQVFGKTLLVTLPITAGANQLLRAGAKVRPLGHVQWTDARSSEPGDSPIECALFILDRDP